MDSPINGNDPFGLQCKIDSKKLCAKAKCPQKCQKSIDDLLQTAKDTAAHFGPDHCERWTDNLIDAKKNKTKTDYSLTHEVWDYKYLKGVVRHVAARVTLYDGTIFYLDDGWWGGLINNDPFCPSDIPSYVESIGTYE